jgi:branched-chain amino acid transport system substrate-binding protein
MKRKGLLVLACLICLSLILMVVPLASGCASQPSSPPATTAKPAITAPATTAPATSSPAAVKPPLKIGAILHLTGENAVLGPGLKNALEYRLEQAGGQIAGRKIELIIEDDGTDPVKSVEKARKLVEQDKVEAILGPVHGACAPAVANYLTTSKTPHLIFMPKSIKVLQGGGGNVFLPFGTLAGTGYSLGLYAYEKLGYKTATVAVEDFVSGLDFIGGVTKAFEKAGGKIIQTQPIKPGTMDFSTNLTAMQQADAAFLLRFCLSAS